MIQRRNDKKGSTSILIIMLFLSLLLAVSTFVNASGYQAGKSYAKASLDLASRSVLAEYLKPLKQSYGLFAFKGDSDLINERLYFYAQESYAQDTVGEEGAIDVLGLRIDSVDIDLKAFSMLDINAFENQILEQMKYRVLLSEANSLESIAQEISQGALLIRLVEKAEAVYQKMGEMEQYLSRITVAHKEIALLEKQMMALLNKESTSITELQANTLKLRGMAYDTRRLYEIILFNLSRIKIFSKDLIAALDAFDDFLQENQKNLLSGLSAELLEKISPAKALLSHFNDQGGQSYKQAIDENIRQLSAFEASTEDTTESLVTFRQNYNWLIDLSLLSEFIPSEEESLGKKERLNDMMEQYNKAAQILTAAEEGRVLRNQRIISGLPSSMGNTSDWKPPITLDLNALMTIEEVITKGIKTVQVDNYIGLYMTDKQCETDKSRFFQNEVEYVLYGNKSDDMNYMCFKTNYFALRTALNLIHIYSSTEKRAQISAMATSITPGPWSLCTELLIATAWASCEAQNDLKLVESGNRVALIKSAKNWAVDLDFLLSGSINNTLTSQEPDKGLNYRDYLQLFLLFEPRDIKLLRSLDLIQINLIGNYNKDFRLKDYYWGFRYDAFISKRSLLPDMSLFQPETMEISGIQLY